MNPATIVLRLLGIVFVAASFFVARILMVFPGLPLEIGPVPTKTLIFVVGVLLYAAGAVMDKMAWNAAHRAGKDEL